MKRKRFIKLMMGIGVSRNEATVYADACGRDMPHILMGLLVMTQPSMREIVRASLTQIMQGTSFSVYLEAENEATDI